MTITQLSTTEIQELIARDRMIAIFWMIEDVQSIRPDLSDDQAWEVLQLAKRFHDAEVGINWESLNCAANCLYTEPDELDDGESIDI